MSSLIDEFCRRLQPWTAKCYRASLKQLASELKVGLEQATRIDIDSFIAGLEKNYAPRTVRFKVSVLHVFYQFCLERGLVKTNPAPKNYRLKGRVAPLPIPDDHEIRRLTEVLASSQQLTDRRDRVMLELVFHTGIRVSELTSLNCHNVSLETKTLRIPGRYGRTLSLPDPLIPLLEQYLKERPATPTPALFLNYRKGPLSDRSVRRKWRTRSAEIGLQETICPQSLRRRFIKTAS